MIRASITRKCPSVGLTTVELMVAIAVIGILTVVAVPGIRDNVRQHRLSNQISDFVTALQLAQNEAVSRARPIVVCKSNNAESATPACGSAGVQWSDGWIVFVDPDNDGVLDAGEPIVRANGSFTSGLLLNGSAGFGSAVTFSASGSLPNGGSFVLCDSGDLRYARAVMLGNNGRVHLAQMSPRGTPLDDNVQEITTCAP